MKLLASLLQLPRSQKIKIEKFDDAGTLLAHVSASFLESDEYDRYAKKLGIDAMDLVELIDNRYRKQRKPELVIINGRQVPPPIFRVRSEIGMGKSARVYDDFMEAMQFATDKHVIEWDVTYWCCILDVDFHGTPPKEHELIKLAELLTPSPVAYWLSKHGGLHCAYYASGIYDASELASVAGYSVLRKFPECKLEFLSRTRGSKGVVTRSPTNDVGSIKSLLNVSTDDDREQYLADKGWTIGQRVPHIECPVNPHERGKNNTDPVVMRDTFIHCYICASDGIRYGSKQPGIFPYATLAGSKQQTQIAICIMNFVHWSHAKHVIGQKIKDEQTAKKVYSALLKTQHGDDNRIALVFTAGEPNGLVRYDGYWCDSMGRTLKLDKSSHIIKQLPHAMTVNRAGLVATDLAQCEWLTQTVDQSSRGYFALSPIRGIHITKFQDLPSNKVYTVLNIPELEPEEMVSKRPRYLAQSDRIPIDDAKCIIAKVFPKIDWKLIELLIVGRGCSEHRSGLPPMLFITGPTASGKTSHIQVAAAICGDKFSDVKLNKDRDRFNNALLTAKNHGGFVFFDEFFKFADQAGMDDVEAMENLLAFTKDQLCYMIYVGSVPLGELPLFIWADSDIPVEVQAHAQIGRRVFHHQLMETLEWENTLQEYSIGEPSNLRLYGTPEMLNAANCILSDIIDTYFRSPVTDFAEVAEALGVPRLRDSTGALGDKQQLIRELYEAICIAPEITNEDDRRRFSKPGFRMARAEGVCPVYKAYELCQTQGEHNSTKCRLVEETDLKLLLNLKIPARMEVRKHGSKYAIRFVSQDGNTVNKGLI